MNHSAKQNYDISVLRRAMIAQFLNYKQLAQKADLDYQAVYRVFNYRRNGRIRKPELVARLANTLNVPIEKVIIEEAA